MRRTAGNCGHFVCKIADTQLVYDFSALNRGPNPVHVIFVDRPHVQCCPRSECGVSEDVLS